MDRDAKSKRKKRLLIYVFVGVLIFVFIILPAAGLTGLWFTERQKRDERPPQVVVPDVVGQDYRKGESVLEEKGLKMRVLATRWDQSQQVGVIIDQSPAAGESVEVGHSIGVTVGGKPGQQFGQPQR